LNGLNFLPTEYKNRRANFIINIVKNANFIIFAFNLILLFYAYKQYTKYKDVTNENYKLSQEIRNKKVIVNNEDISKDIKIVDIYEEVNKYLEDDRIERADISENEIKISIFHSSLDNYLRYIKAIEASKEFKIIDLQTPIRKEFGIENNIVLKYIK
jgi:hypothetical protein